MLEAIDLSWSVKTFSPSFKYICLVRKTLQVTQSAPSFFCGSDVGCVLLSHEMTHAASPD